MEISISKEVLHSLEELGFTETVLGDPRGCVRQYRNSTGLHVREYDDRFVVHRDEIDPRTNPIGHLMKDSPETLLALGSTLAMSRAPGRTTKNSFSPIFLLFLFLSLNRLLGLLKKFL